MNIKPAVFSSTTKIAVIVWISFLFLAACTNPITIATSEDLHQAYQRAFAEDAIAEIYQQTSLA